MKKDDAGPVTRAEAMRSFSALLSRVSQPRLLLSHEALIGLPAITFGLGRERMFPLMGRAARFLKELCGDHECHIIVYIRSQPSFLESLYLQYVMGGKARRFDEYFKKVATSSLAWRPLVEEIADIVGKDRTVVGTFETVGVHGPREYLRQFIASTGTETDFELRVSPDQNRSYSGKALEIANRVYPILTVEERKKLRVFLQKHFSNRDYARAALLSEATKEGILRQHEEGNRYVFRHFLTAADEEVRLAYFPWERPEGCPAARGRRAPAPLGAGFGGRLPLRGA